MLVLVSNAGLAFQVHYCGDKIASVSFTSFAKNTQKTCCGKLEKKSSCCKDREIKPVKKTDHSFAKTFSFQLEIPLASYDWKPIESLVPVSIKNNTADAFYCDSNAPPLYKLYSQYLLYA